MEDNENQYDDTGDYETPTSIIAADETDVIGFIKNINSRNQKSGARPVQSKPLSVPADSEYYDMTHKYRGVALIFNHMKFKSMPPRNGANKDRERVEKIFKMLDFDVCICDDFGYNDIKNVLSKVSQQDHSNHDCLAVVVMTHGETGVLYARDYQYPVDEIWKQFIGKNCETLIGKPKLFFINACRGDKLDAGESFTKKALDSVDSLSNKQKSFSIPTMADLLVMYSTFEGHYSWRNPDRGSWFVQALCDEMIENGKSRDLLTLLTGVNRRVAYEFQSNVPQDKKMDAMKQMPSIVTMLTKMLYFTKKLNNKIVAN